MAVPVIVTNILLNMAVKEAGKAFEQLSDAVTDTSRAGLDPDALGLGDITKNILELSEILGTPAVVNAVNLGDKAMEIVGGMGGMANKVEAVRATDPGFGGG